MDSKFERIVEMSYSIQNVIQKLSQTAETSILESRLASCLYRNGEILFLSTNTKNDRRGSGNQILGTRGKIERGNNILQGNVMSDHAEVSVLLKAFSRWYEKCGFIQT